MNTSYSRSFLFPQAVPTIVLFHHAFTINTLWHEVCSLHKTTVTRQWIWILYIEHNYSAWAANQAFNSFWRLLEVSFILHGSSSQKSVWEKSSETSQPRSEEESVRKYHDGIQQKKQKNNKNKHNAKKQIKVQRNIHHDVQPDPPNPAQFTQHDRL